ncbi:MAG TPA: hypothetical protein VJ672_05730 [Gemmatimonadaceae bacterium]|nr:hypothetical protein [Gemmatimonadaceae bacterium]
MPDSRGARRLSRRSSHPTLSVILLSRGEGSTLGAVATALQKQCAAFEAELLIVRAASQSEVAATTRAFPAARVIAAPIEATDPELRVLGMGEATGDIVTFTTDRAAVPDRWIERFQRALGRDGEPSPSASGDKDAIIGE